MKNPVVSYVVIAIGVIALAVGAYFLATGGHQLRAYGGLGAGVVLIIAGIAAFFVLKPKAEAK
jgi:hypothetical protein